MLEQSKIETERKPTARCRVTNGKTPFLSAVDGRSSVARRWADLHDALARAVGLPLSDAQAMLTRRAATMAVLCELSEASLVSGEKIDADEYLRLTGTLGRVLAALGLQANVSGDGDDVPSLAQYLASRGATAE